jgi:hypothetical protein
MEECWKFSMKITDTGNRKERKNKNNFLTSKFMSTLAINYY